MRPNPALLLTNAGDCGSGGLAGARAPRYLLSVPSRTPCRYAATGQASATAAFEKSRQLGDQDQISVINIEDIRRAVRPPQ